MTATAWMDRRVVTAMSTTSQPSATGTVLRHQKDGTRISVTCPEAIIIYNRYMGGVDRGNQLRGYCNCKVKSRKFYKFIFYSLFDVSITNAFILLQEFPLFTHLQHHQEVSAAASKRSDGRVYRTSLSWSWW